MSAENLDNASMEDFRNVAAEAVEQRRRAEGAEARAEAAERKVAAVEALANEWDRVSRGGEDHIRTCTCVRDPLHPELPRCARCIVAEAAMDLRAALDTAAEPPGVSGSHHRGWAGTQSDDGRNGPPSYCIECSAKIQDWVPWPCSAALDTAADPDTHAPTRRATP